MDITKSILGLLGWLAVTFAAAWVGSRFKPDGWYASLTKPSWNPPNAIFAPVWSVLYVLMGVAAWLVWRRAGFEGAGAALGLFAGQLVLNALWPYLFFGQHRLDLAFFDIVALVVTILAVMLLFWPIDTGAGALMLPYLVWVSFATLLNFVLWRLNRI